MILGRAEDIFSKVKNEGKQAIEEFLLNKQWEDLFLDFKRSTDNGSNARLDQRDREHLAKAISGFGNSEGGVIIWGVDCCPNSEGADLPSAMRPIQNPRRFVSWIENAVSGCTIPPHTNVENYAVELESGNEGFVVTYIARSNNAPHQIVSGLRDAYKYLIRAGASFVPTPHAVLAGMFGRRPQPNMKHKLFTEPVSALRNGADIVLFDVSGILGLQNLGPGIARDAFVNATVLQNINENCLSFTANTDWLYQNFSSFQSTAICKPHIRISPESYIAAFNIFIRLKPPFVRDMEIHITYGCADAPPTKFLIKSTKEQIALLYEEYLKKLNADTLTDKDRREFSSQLFNLD